MFTRPDELSTYNRHWLPPKISRTRTFTWVWTYTSEVATFAPVRMRIYRIDGQDPVFIGDWIKPPIRQVPFQVTIDDDYFIGWPETENNADMVIPWPLIVNSTGKALPVRRPWTCFDRFDLTHNYAGQGFDVRMVAQVAVGRNVIPAPTYPFKPRTFVPIVNPAKQDQMYVRRPGRNIYYKHPDLFEVPTPGMKAGECDAAVARGMNYFYSEMVSYDGKPNGLLPPIPPMLDGPRGFCTLPGTAKLINRIGGLGTFGVSTLGSIFFLNGDYKRSTLGGWRNKLDMLPPHPSYRLSDPEWYADHFDFVGDRSLMGPDWYPPEMWSMAVAEKFNPGNTHEFWPPVTMQDEIAAVSHWTAHPEASYEPMRYPPPGYTSPAKPTGQPTWIPFIRNHPLCKQPWGIDSHPLRDEFWFTNYDSGGAKAALGGGGFITRCKRTAATVEGLEITAVHKPPAVMDNEIGVGARLHDAQLLGPWSTMIAQNDGPDVLCGRWFGKVPTDFAAVEAGAVKINGVSLAAIPVATTAAQRVAQLVAAMNAVSAQSHVTAWVTPSGAYSPLKGGTTFERIGWTDRQLVVDVRDPVTAERTGLQSVTRQMYVIDGPLDPDGKGNGASCIHPQDCGFQSDGTLIWAERYPYVIRSIPSDDSGVRTLTKIRPLGFAATSSGDNDCSISIDDQDRIYVRTWNRNLVFDKAGKQLGTFGGTLAKALPPGLASLVSPGEYGWAVAANAGRIVTSSNAGHPFLELSQRQPSDVVPDQNVRARGLNSMLWSGHKSMALTHGAFLENSIGGPNVETFGAYSDAALRTYFRDKIGIPDAEIADVIGHIRSRTVDHQYPDPLLETSPDEWTVPPVDGGGEPPEDPNVIADLQKQVADLQAKVDAANATNSQLTTASAQMQQQLADLNTQLQAAQAALAAAQGDKDRAKQLQGVVDGFTSAMADIVAAASVPELR